MENYEFEEEKRLKALLEEISTIDRKVLADVMQYLGRVYENRDEPLVPLHVREGCQYSRKACTQRPA